MPLTAKITHWLEQHIGTISHAEQLMGSTSTTLYRITDSTHTDYVLRLYDNKEWLAIEPDLCPHEAAALQTAQSASVKTPKLIAYEADANIAGMPLLLMEHLVGEVWLKPDNMDDWLKQSAAALAAIHAIDTPDFAWRFFHYTRRHQLKVPSWSEFPEKWAQIIAILQEPDPDTPQVFIHRDYHMTNFLWQGGELTGVVDWINACIGFAGIDVGHMRSNLAQLYGVTIADNFLTAYQTANPDFDYQPYWDLVAIGDTALYEEDSSPSVYPPWLEFGMQNLSDALMLERSEAYASSVLARL